MDCAAKRAQPYAYKNQTYFTKGALRDPSGLLSFSAMADNYIDYEETQIYGPFAVKKITEVALKLVPKYDPALQYIAGEIETATAAVGKLLGNTREQDVIRTAGARAKGSQVAEARALLGRFSKHLDAHKKGEVARKLYMPSNLSQIGRTPSRVMLALGNLKTALAAKNCPVHEASSWLKEVTAAAAALAPLVADTDSAKTTRRTLTPEIEAARSSWLLVYLAAKSTVEAVLRLTGKLQLMPEVFYDLAVPRNTKVTAPPGPSITDPAAAPSSVSPPASAVSSSKKPSRKRPHR